MPLLNSSEQSSQSLEAFYIHLAENSTNHYADVGRNMLPIVAMINELFPETLIYGLNSHARLVLQTEDNWQSPWYVIISNLGMAEYHLEYLMPANERPWEGATVRGTARNLTEARRYLLLAMKACGAWADNAELSQHLQLTEA